MRKLGIPPENLQPDRYAGPRFAVVPCFEAKRRPTVLDRDYSLLSRWRVSFDPTTGEEGEVWELVRFESNGDATWRLNSTTASGSPILTNTVDRAVLPGVNPVVPDGSGDIDVLGTHVANHDVPLETVSRGINAYNIEIQVAKAITGAPGNRTGAGICTFDDTAFTVDADGYVQLAGGAGPAIDTLTGNGGTPVTPTAAGNVTLVGATVANGTNAAPVWALDTVPNTLTMQVQVGAARTGAPADRNDAGMVSFDDTAFNVDANGYVTLSGGAGPAIDSIQVDAVTGPGVNPVVGTAAGLITVQGSAVVAHSVPIETRSRAANTYNVEVQYASSAASTTAAESGLAHFKSNEFTVDANGFVSLVNPAAPMQGVQNLGMTLSAGKFSVTSANGTALSSTNPGYVTLPSVANPGQLITITVTDNHEFIDDNGSSTVAGMLWGTTTAVDWGNDMPFFLYAIMKDDDSDVAFAISRSPANEISYAASNLGVRGATVTTGQNSFFLLDKTTGPTSPTVGDYDQNPSLLVGSFRMRKTSGASNDWTVQTLGDQDGIGRFNWNTVWNMPAGVNGSASGKYFQATTGSPPTFITSAVLYLIQRNGLMYVEHEHNGISVAGSGAGDFRPTLPCTGLLGSDAWMAHRLTTPNQFISNGTLNGGNIYLEKFIESGGTTGYTNATFTANSSFTTKGMIKAFQ